MAGRKWEEKVAARALSCVFDVALSCAFRRYIHKEKAGYLSTWKVWAGRKMRGEGAIDVALILCLCPLGDMKKPQPL
jgi:hypothetical protein